MHRDNSYYLRYLMINKSPEIFQEQLILIKNIFIASFHAENVVPKNAKHGNLENAFFK